VTVVPDDLRRELVERIPWVGGHADVWRTFSDERVFPRLVTALADPYRGAGVTKVAGIEARGFILAAAVAVELSAGLVAIRKAAGLFPGEKIVRVTDPDYRGHTSTLRLQVRSLNRGDRVLLVDDWLETGSQGLAAKAMIEEAGAVLVGASVIVDQLSDRSRGLLGPLTALIPFAALDPSVGYAGATGMRDRAGCGRRG
jgi:adenine phosphoribosyltransferase